MRAVVARERGARAREQLVEPLLLLARDTRRDEARARAWLGSGLGLGLGLGLGSGLGLGLGLGLGHAPRAAPPAARRCALGAHSTCQSRSKASATCAYITVGAFSASARST